MTLRPISGSTPPPGQTRGPASHAPAAPPAPADQAEISGEAEPRLRPSVRVLAGVALAVALATALAGCGPQPPAPGPPGTSQPAPPKENPTGASVPLETRLSRLKKEDGRAYLRLAEANFYRHVLEKVKPGEGADLQRLHQAAGRGLERFRTEDDPLKLRDGMEAVLREMAGGPALQGTAGTYQAMASSAVKVGDAMRTASPNGDAGLVVRLKAAGYEKALDQFLKLPEELAARGVVDAEQARAFMATYADAAQAALEAGRDVKDPAVQAPLYEATLRQLYERSERDGSEIARQVRQILDVALRLKDGLF